MIHLRALQLGSVYPLQGSILEGSPENNLHYKFKELIHHVNDPFIRSEKTQRIPTQEYVSSTCKTKIGHQSGRHGADSGFCAVLCLCENCPKGHFVFPGRAIFTQAHPTSSTPIVAHASRTHFIRVLRMHFRNADCLPRSVHKY